MSINSLAAKISRSAGYISQIERGLSQPTLKDLYAISTSLDVTISWFLAASNAENNLDDERDIVVRQQNRRTIAQEGIVTQVLSPRLSPETEFMQSRFPPGSETEAKDVANLGTEWGVVVEGSLELWYGSRHFLLGPGDSYSFKRDQPYRTRNPSATDETVVIWFVSY